MDGHLLDLAQCVTELHAVLTDETRARLKERMDALDGSERLAFVLLLSDLTTIVVFTKLQKASQPPFLLDTLQTWLRFGAEDIFG